MLFYTMFKEKQRFCGIAYPELSLLILSCQFLTQPHVQGTQRRSCHWLGDLCWFWPSISLLLCEIKEQAYYRFDEASATAGYFPRTVCEHRIAWHRAWSNRVPQEVIYILPSCFLFVFNGHAENQWGSEWNPMMLVYQWDDDNRLSMRPRSGRLALASGLVCRTHVFIRSSSWIVGAFGRFLCSSDFLPQRCAALPLLRNK